MWYIHCTKVQSLKAFMDVKEGGFLHFFYKKMYKGIRRVLAILYNFIAINTKKRVTRFERATFSLATRCSTAELYPRKDQLYILQKNMSTLYFHFIHFFFSKKNVSSKVMYSIILSLPCNGCTTFLPRRGYKKCKALVSYLVFN